MLGTLIEAINTNNADLVKGLLSREVIFTKEDYVQLNRDIEMHKGPMSLEIRKILSECQLKVLTAKNEIQIIVPHFNVEEFDEDFLIRKLGNLIIPKNSYVTITDKVKKESITIPTSTYLLICKEFKNIWEC